MTQLPGQESRSFVLASYHWNSLDMSWSRCPPISTLLAMHLPPTGIAKSSEGTMPSTSWQSQFSKCGPYLESTSRNIQHTYSTDSTCSTSCDIMWVGFMYLGLAARITAWETGHATFRRKFCTNMHERLKNEGLQYLLPLPSASRSRNSRMSYHRTGKYWRSGMSSIAFTKSSLAFTGFPLT